MRSIVDNRTFRRLIYAVLDHAPTKEDLDCFLPIVRNLSDLYTRPLGTREVVLSFDEKVSLQPQTRVLPTLPAEPGHPVRSNTHTSAAVP